MKYLFLLGGHDLEMKEIKNILDEQSIPYIDKNLRWDNAKLSQYKDEIKEHLEKDSNIKIVAVELTNDLNMTSDRLIEIDHHNEKSHLPSSLEQVASLLGIELTRKQRLVAENDKGYIPYMEKFGATKDEIAYIRRLDREMQGVSEEDEKLADEAIKNKKTIDNIVVVKSETSKFSPIVDKLYPTERLLIYTDTELTYYGKYAKQLGKEYKNKYGNNVYYGGSGDGFFGIYDTKITGELICKIIEKMKK